MVLRYGDNSYAAGEFGSDILRIDNSEMKIIDMEFIKAYEANTLGVFGIGMPGLEVSAHKPDNPFEYKNFPIRLQEAGFIDSIAYSMWLNTPTSTSGMVIFGGVDLKKFTPPLVKIDLVPTFKNKILEFTIPASIINYFEAPCTTPFLLSDDPIVVLMEVGSTSSYLPNSVVTGLSEKLHMTQDEDGDYVRSCNYTGDDTKFITIRLADFDLKIPVTHLILPKASLDGVPVLFDNGDPVCYLGIYPTDNPKFCSLGDNVLRSAYLVFDLDNKRLAVAQTKTDSLESNILAIRPGKNGIPGSTDVYNAPSLFDTCKNYTYGNYSGISTFSTSLPITTKPSNFSTKPLPFIPSNITDILSKQNANTSFSTSSLKTQATAPNIVSTTFPSYITSTFNISSNFSTEDKIILTSSALLTSLNNSLVHTYSESLITSHEKSYDLLSSTPSFTTNNKTWSFDPSVSTLSTSMKSTSTVLTSLNPSPSIGEKPVSLIQSTLFTTSVVASRTEIQTITSTGRFSPSSTNIPLNIPLITSTRSSSFHVNDSITILSSFVSFNSRSFSDLPSRIKTSEAANQTESFNQNLAQPHTSVKSSVKEDLSTKDGMTSTYSNLTSVPIPSLNTGSKISTYISSTIQTIPITTNSLSNSNNGISGYIMPSSIADAFITSITRSSGTLGSLGSTFSTRLPSTSNKAPGSTIFQSDSVSSLNGSQTSRIIISSKKLEFINSVNTTGISITFNMSQNSNTVSPLNTNINLISTEEVYSQIPSKTSPVDSNKYIVTETSFLDNTFTTTETTMTNQETISLGLKTLNSFQSQTLNTILTDAINRPANNFLSHKDQTSNFKYISSPTLTSIKSLETEYPLTYETTMSDQKAQKINRQPEPYFKNNGDKSSNSLSVFVSSNTNLHAPPLSLTGDLASQNRFNDVLTSIASPVMSQITYDSPSSNQIQTRTITLDIIHPTTSMISEDQTQVTSNKNSYEDSGYSLKLETKNHHTLPFSTKMFCETCDGNIFNNTRIFTERPRWINSNSSYLLSKTNNTVPQVSLQLTYKLNTSRESVFNAVTSVNNNVNFDVQSFHFPLSPGHDLKIPKETSSLNKFEVNPLYNYQVNSANSLIAPGFWISLARIVLLLINTL